MEWALDTNGKMPGREFFDSLNESDQAKVLALFKLLAETGQIRNREKFQKLEGTELFEFKSFQLRFHGDFRPGRRFVVASGVRKKKQKADKSDLQVAARILKESDQR